MGQCPEALLPAEAGCGPHFSDSLHCWASCPGSDPAPDTQLEENSDLELAAPEISTMTKILVATFVVANVPGGCFATQALGQGLRWSEAGLGSCNWSMD